MEEPSDWFLDKPPIHETTSTYVKALHGLSRNATSSRVPPDFREGERRARRKAARKAQRKARKKSKKKRR